ncbi:DUF4156 domain-containing protein [Herbaspirillum seropedicae]|uniref:DUF4156 domain-containing protein n=1 Tax=Herbaspirillum seropedicae TaxID=964 RepID=UPI0015DF2CF2
MKNLTSIGSTLICAAAIAGCASKPISAGAARVQVHKQVSTLLADCRKLGPVTGTGSKPLGNAIPSSGAFNEALGELREATYAMQGDSVAVINSQESVSKVSLQGIAYRCF